MYASDDKNQIYLYTKGPGGNDSLERLMPKYLKDPKVFLCPSTENYLKRTPLNTPANPENQSDLKDNAVDTLSIGHSYESRAWHWTGDIYTDGVRFEAGTMPNDGVGTGGVWKTIKNTRRPDTVGLISESDDTIGGVGANNYPDAHNNHGDQGMVWGFADGHAAFILAGRPLVEVYMTSHYKPNFGATEAAIFTKARLKKTGNKYEWF
jgi:hypothetical protein